MADSEVACPAQTPDQCEIVFSIVMVTYARDRIVELAIKQVAVATELRPDVEFILVDNNPDQVDRGSMLNDFVVHTYIKIGWNKGYRPATTELS